MATTPVVIRTRGLEKRYQRADGDEKVAVRSLDLDIRQGEVFGLLGPNGAGKTTTILMLLGLTEPTSGTALVLGFDPLRDPLQVKRHVGYLPDNVGFYEAMTGRENLRYTARLNGIPDGESDASITELLGRVGRDAEPIIANWEAAIGEALPIPRSRSAGRTIWPRPAARRPRRLRRIPHRRPQGLGAGPEGVRREARLLFYGFSGPRASRLLMSSSERDAAVRKSRATAL